MFRHTVYAIVSHTHLTVRERGSDGSFEESIMQKLFDCRLVTISQEDVAGRDRRERLPGPILCQWRALPPRVLAWQICPDLPFIGRL